MLAAAGQGRPYRGSWAAAGLGIILFLAGLAGAALGPPGLRWQLGTAGCFLGAFLFVVLGPRGAGLEGTGLPRQFYRTLDGLLGDLKLEGHGIYIAAGTQPGLRADRVFVPEGHEVTNLTATLDEATFVYGGPKGGVALDPPGRALLDAHEERIGARIGHAPLGELPVLLQDLSDGERLLKELSLRRSGDTIAARYRPGRYGVLCRQMQEDHPQLSRQLGCPTCSAIVLAVARATGRPVRIVSVGERQDEITLSLEVLP